MSEMNRSVVSLKLAKKLKEAGWTKPTAFDWVDIPARGGFRVVQHGLGSQVYPAPTAQELADELPVWFPELSLRFNTDLACWEAISTTTDEIGKLYKTVTGDTMADALALLSLEVSQ